MADQGRIEFVNFKDLDRAYALAPQQLRVGVKQQFKRTADKFFNQVRKDLYQGPPGIHLPARATSREIKALTKNVRGKRGFGGQVKRLQLRHFKSTHAVIPRRGPPTAFIWSARLTRFSTYHEQKLRPIFEGRFVHFANDLSRRLNTEIPRLIKGFIEGTIKFGVRGVSN